MIHLIPPAAAWLALAAAALLAACGGGGGSDPVTQTVAVQFTAVANGETVRCGSRIGHLGRTDAAADLKDLRFYVGDLALVNDQGQAVPVTLDSNPWQLSQGTRTVALIDLEDASGACSTASNTTATHATLTGSVPIGTYVGLQATLAVPETLNHSAITGGQAPLDVAAMAWSWQSGRKFAKIELNPVGGILRTVAATTTTVASTSTLGTFNIHVGATGCTARLDGGGAAVLDGSGNPVYTCAAPNAMAFRLERFNPRTQQVALDLGQLLAGTDLTRDDGGAAGCMSGATDPECPPIFSALQLSFGSGADGLPIQGGAAQRVFQAVAK